MRGSALAPEAGTCSTTKIVAGRSASSAATNSLRLSTPPAEAPTTTRSRQPIALVAAVAIGSAVELIYAFPSADSVVGQGRPGGGTLPSELENLDFTPSYALVNRVRAATIRQRRGTVLASVGGRGNSA